MHAGEACSTPVSDAPGAAAASVSKPRNACAARGLAGGVAPARAVLALCPGDGDLERLAGSCLGGAEAEVPTAASTASANPFLISAGAIDPATAGAASTSAVLQGGAAKLRKFGPPPEGECPQRSMTFLCV